MSDTSATERPRILLVEDEAALREHLANVLSDEYTVETATNGREALVAILRAPPALIVTDIVMPEVGGIELLTTLRNTRRTQTIPVLLISGRTLDEQRIEGFQQGADGYLTKPYTERELRAYIGSMLRVVQRRDEAAREHAERQVLTERAALLENMTDAFYALDQEFRFTYLNQRALEHFGQTREALLGKVLWDVLPVTRGSLFQREYERVQREQCTVAFEAPSLISGRWLDVRAYPTPQGLAAHFRDISDRKYAEEQVKEADRRKTEFLAVLAHELRNPLAPLRNGLHILKLRGTSDPAQLSQIVGMMGRQTEHLVRLVDDLLDVSRITRGRMELRRRPVLLTDVLESALESSRTFIDSREHGLVLGLAKRDLWVNGDPDRLAQVFSNLLFNSAKYTPRGGRIALDLGREGSFAVISLQDNGVGIAPSALEEIFHLFYHARTSATQATEGLGIGLSLVRMLVGMHGGSVRASSEGPGKGSTFTVRLPIVEGGIGEPPTLAPVYVRQQAQRILVVDDNADAAVSLALLLETLGHEVHTAADGEKAIAQSRAFDPDIIFMDLGMPGLDGIEAARRIRALPHGARARIIALTGWGQEADRQRTREAGMEHHLTKPVSLDALQDVLGRSPK
jgi:PAS domain S-box-containing protein